MGPEFLARGRSRTDAFAFYRPLTLPNFLDSKKPGKSTVSHSRRPYTIYGGSGGSSSSSVVHGHDFKPSRGSSGGGLSGYSYGTGGGPHADDYHDGQLSPYHSPPVTGPKSFVSVSSDLGEDVADGAYNVDHAPNGYDYYSSGDRSGYRSPSYDYAGNHDRALPSGRYETDDYRSPGPDDENVYPRFGHEYSANDGAEKSSPYYPSNLYGDYSEPSSTSVQSSRRSNIDGGGKSPRKQKAFWRMSYVQNI